MELQICIRRHGKSLPGPPTGCVAVGWGRLAVKGVMFGGNEYFMDLAKVNLVSAESAV